MLASPEAYMALTRVRRLLSSVRTIALRDLGVVMVGREAINVRKGDEVSLPLWLALELRRGGYVELRDVTLRDVDLFRYYHMERTSKGGKLVDVREDLYLSAGMTIRKLGEEKTPDSLSAAERLKRVLSNMLDLRLGKLMSAALYLEARHVSEVSNVLEEMVLYTLLRRVIRSWRDSVLRYAE